MAHESFEDAATADVMNRQFVSVKVDREERLDVDAIYMQAVQTMTGHGGWPMTVFLAPDGRPFFGGTYFPKTGRHGLPGFVEVLDAVADAWDHRRDELLDQAVKLTDHIAQADRLRPSTEPLTTEILQRAYASAVQQFDGQLGGFGAAPKFPQTMTLDFLLRTHLRNHAPETLAMVQLSLDAMASGGMYDQLGGGFHRYSVDAGWLVPHFEKMLYDQALLARVYLHAFLVTGEPRYRTVVEETVTYVLRDLRHPAGGFYSAEDADSEGVEGKFYVWSRAELRDVCGADADDVAAYYGVTEAGNFEGANILHVAVRGTPRPPEVERWRSPLFEQREQRVHPARDDKVLLAWNALMLDSLAEAAAALERPDWMDAARANARFLLDGLRRDDARLLRSWQDGRASHLAYAEDYAALVSALLTLAEVDDVMWLADARTVADALLSLFGDDESGGFFTTGRDAEELITRPKDLFDNATPSANSLASEALLRLAAFTGEHGYEHAAVGVLRLLAVPMAQHPTAFAHLLGALERYLTPPLEVVVVGARAERATAALEHEVRSRFLPASVSVVAPPGAGADLTPLLADRLPAGAPTAYVCEHYACKQPVTNPADLRAQLDDVLASRAR
jgi:hypothetical protein